jgi:hypothetical protein
MQGSWEVLQWFGSATVPPSSEELSAHVSETCIVCAHQLTKSVSSYTEAIDLLYTQKTFILVSAFQFPMWASSISERHLGLVRSLVLHLSDSEVDLATDAQGWPRTLETLPKMTQLKRCRIVVEETYNADKIAPIMESLKALKSKTAFAIDLVNYYWETESRRVFYLHERLVPNERR